MTAQASGTQANQATGPQFRSAVHNLNRREAMRLGFLGGGLLTLAACARPMLPGPPAARAFERRGIYVDTHTHIFNADDLSVKGFLSDVIGTEVRKHVPSFTARRVSAILDRLIQRTARGHRRESDRLDRLLSVAEGLAPAQKDRALRELEEGLPSEEAFRREVEEALGEVILEELGLEEWPKLLRELAPHLNKLAENLRLGERLGLEELGKEMQGFFLKGRLEPLFEFVFRMVWYRYKNAERLIKLYGGGEDGVDLFVPALVDMEYWLHRDPPETSIPDQIGLMEKIVRLTTGRILPFAPYDPWRQIDENGAALRNVKWAVMEMGFAGVKLYPPMGFRPLGNAALNRPEDWPGHARSRADISEFGAKLDRAMHDLFKWCAKENVPIMAHGNDSNEAGRRYGKRAAPKWWAKVYDFPGNGDRPYKNLKVNLGHFGGWKSLLGQGGWPWDIGRLMQSNTSLFADLSSFNKIHGTQNRQKLADALQVFYRKFPAAESQLIYGSDWLMNAFAKDSAGYRRNFAVLYKEKFPQLLTRFFGHNAVEFLGLRKGSGNRARLDAYYASRGLKPAWRERLDGSA